MLVHAASVFGQQPTAVSELTQVYEGLQVRGRSGMPCQKYDGATAGCSKRTIIALDESAPIVRRWIEDILLSPPQFFRYTIRSWCIRGSGGNASIGQMMLASRQRLDPLNGYGDAVQA